MKLEKRDIAEALGLVYNGMDYTSENDGSPSVDYHCFVFKGKEIHINHRLTLEDAWEEATNKVLEPLVELLKERL